MTSIRSPAIRRTGAAGATRSAAAAAVLPSPSHCSGQAPTRPSREESAATTVPELGTATRPTAMSQRPSGSTSRLSWNVSSSVSGES